MRLADHLGGKASVGEPCGSGKGSSIDPDTLGAGADHVLVEVGAGRLG